MRTCAYVRLVPSVPTCPRAAASGHGVGPARGLRRLPVERQRPVAGGLHLLAPVRARAHDPGLLTMPLGPRG